MFLYYINIKNEKKKGKKIEEMDCQICCKPFTNSKRKKIECAKCFETCCLECILTTIKTDEFSKSVNCMFCKKKTDIITLSTMFPKKTFRDVVLKKYFQEEINEQVSLISKSSKYAKYYKDLEIWKSEEKERKKHIKFLRSEIQSLKRTIWELEYTSYNTKPVEPVGFCNGKKCSTKDCSGYLDEENFCFVCEKTFCKICQEEIKENHECNSETLKSLEVIEKDSKPCPKCNIRISKIDGCDDMWCSNCKSFWNWQTLQVTKQRHNPDHIQWLRERGTLRRTDLVPCEIIYDYRSFINHLDSWDKGIGFITSEQDTFIKNIYSYKISLLPRARFLFSTDTENVFKKMRAKVILGKTKEKDFIQEVLRKKTKSIKNELILEQIETLDEFCRIFLRNILDLLNDTENFINNISNKEKKITIKEYKWFNQMVDSEIQNFKNSQDLIFKETNKISANFGYNLKLTSQSLEV